MGTDHIMQSRTSSMIETAASTAIGFVVAWASTLVILPAFGFQVSGGQSALISCWFTLISLVRGYFVRRLFNHLHGARKESHD